MPKARLAGKTRSRARFRLAGGQLVIGIVGWCYAGWRGKSYPKDLPQHPELEFEANAFKSIEINARRLNLRR